MKSLLAKMGKVEMMISWKRGKEGPFYRWICILTEIAGSPTQIDYDLGGRNSTERRGLLLNSKTKPLCSVIDPRDSNCPER